MTKEQYRNLSRRIDAALLMQISMMFESEAEVENTKAHMEEEKQEYARMKADYEERIRQLTGATVKFS